MGGLNISDIISLCATTISMSRPYIYKIKELGQLKKHLGVWYKWGENSTGRYLESRMESFVQGMKDDFKDIFGHFPKFFGAQFKWAVCLRFIPKNLVVQFI